MTRTEFFDQYAANSHVSPQYLHDNGYTAVECDCNENGCQGWQMVHGVSICTGCGEPVFRKFAKRKGNLDWHSRCFPRNAS